MANISVERDPQARAFRERCECALQNLPDLLLIIDDRGIVEFVSPSCTALVGRTADEIIGNDLHSLLDVVDRPYLDACMNIALHEGDAPTLTHGIMRANGSVTHFETRMIRARNLPIESGPRFVAVCRQIAARPASDHPDETRDDAWLDVAEHLEQPVLVVRSDGVVAAVNFAARDALRLGGHEAKGQPLQHIGSLGLADSTRHLSPAELWHCEGVRVRLRARRTDRTVELLGRVIALLGTPSAGGRVVLSFDLPQDTPAPTLRSWTPDHQRALSPREIAVLRLLANGLDVRAIAVELGISVNTVRVYVKSVLKKLDVRTQLQAVMVALRTGVLQLS